MNLVVFCYDCPEPPYDKADTDNSFLGGSFVRSWAVGVLVTYLLLWIVPFWLVWPLGVLVGLYLVRIIQQEPWEGLTDEHILGVFLGALCSLYYGLMLFLAR